VESPTRFVPANDDDDVLIRSSVVLVELAAVEPVLARVQLTNSEPPGDTLVDPREMFWGTRLLDIPRPARGN